MELSEKISVLRSSDICQALTERELAQIAEVAEVVRYNAGQTIRHQGEREDHALVISSGAAVILYKLDDEQIPVRIVSAGRTVGTAAFAPTPISTSEVRALTPICGLKLPRNARPTIMESNPRAGYEIMKCLSDTLISRIRELYDTIARIQK